MITKTTRMRMTITLSYLAYSSAESINKSQCSTGPDAALTSWRSLTNPGRNSHLFCAKYFLALWTENFSKGTDFPAMRCLKSGKCLCGQRQHTVNNYRTENETQCPGSSVCFDWIRNNSSNRKEGHFTNLKIYSSSSVSFFWVISWFSSLAIRRKLPFRYIYVVWRK